MRVFRSLLLAGLVAVAFIGVPGAHAADQATDDDDGFVAGGGACNGGEVAGLGPMLLGVAGVMMRRRR